MNHTCAGVYKFMDLSYICCSISEPYKDRSHRDFENAIEVILQSRAGGWVTGVFRSLCISPDSYFHLTLRKMPMQ